MTKEQALQFILGISDQTLEPDVPVPNHLNPMFYMTGSFEQDEKLIENYKEAREILKKEIGVE